MGLNAKKVDNRWILSCKTSNNSPLRCHTLGDWKLFMNRTSTDNHCGLHVKNRVKEDNAKTSFFQTDSFLSPDKTGYNEYKNDGQFRIVKVNHSFW